MKAYSKIWTLDFLLDPQGEEMSKKKRKKKGIGILGLVAGGVTILVGVASTGKAGGQEIEPDNGTGNGNGNGTRPPPDTRIQDCIDAGGVWSAQFQTCEFPEKPPDPKFLDSPACGMISTNVVRFALGGGFYFLDVTQKLDPSKPNGPIGWVKTRAEVNPLTLVVFGADFNKALRDWLQCRANAGELN